MSSWPNGKEFAFTILDDTDDATVANVRPVYLLLRELGLRTTKTVWPLACPEGSRLFFAAETLEDPAYADFARELVAWGFEIASHGATMESSLRERTQRGLEALASTLNVSPIVHANHGYNRENLYWGAERYRTLLLRLPLRAMRRLRNGTRYEGHDEGSPYFWGDICKQQFRYVRSFAFRTVNSGAIPPHAPYRVASTPWVNAWFNTADAPDAAAFKRLMSPDAIERLHADGGVCILSTHLGKRFCRDGIVDPAVEATLRDIAARPGWFVPVGTLLDHLVARHGLRTLAPWARWRLELSHVMDRVSGLAMSGAG